MDIHAWFGLSYNPYLVVPRALLQSMPIEWQRKLVDLLGELEQAPQSSAWLEAHYWVQRTDPDRDAAIEESRWMESSDRELGEPDPQLEVMVIEDPMANYRYPPARYSRVRPAPEDKRGA